MEKAQQELAQEILKDSVLLQNLLNDDGKVMDHHGHDEIAKDRRILADKVKKYRETYVDRQRELRQQTFNDVLAETELMSLEVVKTGSVESLHEYAQEQGYTWKQSSKYLFNGYYYKAPSFNCQGYCLLIT